MKDPIASRLDSLRDQWIEFRLVPAARILRWIIAADELRMIETFLELESDDRAGTIPDLFVSCDDPFTDVDSYGAALRQGLIRQYEESRAGPIEDTGEAPWKPPLEAAGAHSLAGLIQACASLCSFHPEIERLVLVLLPAAVNDYGEWQRWLRGAALHLPAAVRLVVVDDASMPVLEPLAASEPERVRSVAADLEMRDFLSEMARLGGTSGPDGQFRLHFTAMSRALGEGRLDEAGSAAQQALAIAARQEWLHLSGAVHFAMATGFMNSGRTSAALASYREADAAGKHLSASDEMLGCRIRLSAALGVGSALLGSGQLAQAAGVYGVSASMAAKLDDAWLLTDCWRMAAYCHEQTGNKAAAWEDGFRALAAAERIPPAQRAHSTIPFVREVLLRLAGDSRPHTQAVEEAVGLLLGAQAPSAASPAAVAEP